MDINFCIEHAHAENMLQFVAGFGPRKAVGLLKVQPPPQLYLLGVWFRFLGRRIFNFKIDPRLLHNVLLVHKFS